MRPWASTSISPPPTTVAVCGPNTRGLTRVGRGRTGTSTANVITAGGGNDDGWRSEVAGSRSQITTPRVQVGSRSFEVDTPGLYRVGDEVILWHPSTQAWIDAVNRGGVSDQNFWRPGEIDIRFHRYITAVAGNTITVDAPVFNHLDRSLSQSYLYKYDRAGMVTRIWADCDLIHVLIAGTRIKTVRSHLSVNDLARLVAQGAVPAGPSPLPPVDADSAERGVVEVERCVSRLGLVSLGGRQLLAAEILGGRRVGIRIVLGVRVG